MAFIFSENYVLAVNLLHGGSMKKSIVVLDVGKYIFVVLLLLFGAYKYNQGTDFFIYAVVLFALLIVILDILSIRARAQYIRNDSFVKEIRELNLEAASQNDSMHLLHERAKEKGNGLKEFADRISSIRNELNLKNHELEALRETSHVITSTFDVNTIIEYIYQVINRFTGCDRYLISFVDKEGLIFKYEFGSIMLGEVGNKVRKESIVTKCYESKSLIKDINVFINSRNLYGDKIAIPLNASGEMVGVMFIESGIPASFSDVNLDFLENLAVYAAIAVKNAELFNSIFDQKQEIEALYEETAAVNDELSNYIDELNKTKEELKDKNEELTSYYDEIQTGYFQTVMALANSIEAKDPYTRGHCQRVMEISCEIAKAMGMNENQIDDLKYAAILHDIGKIGISASILNKDGKLTEEEFSEIKKHPSIAFNILKEVEFIKNGLDGILQHHERNDGFGYPNGLKGDEISAFGKILCIADAFDAMTSDRPYRKGMSMRAAITEIERCKGSQFDPDIATLFIHMSKQILSTDSDF